MFVINRTSRMTGVMRPLVDVGGKKTEVTKIIHVNFLRRHVRVPERMTD